MQNQLMKNSAGLVTSSRQSLEIKEGTTRKEWAEVGVGLLQARETTYWALGDWLNWGTEVWGDALTVAVNLCPEKNASSLRQWAWVCKNVPPSRRRPTLTFTHHREVASMTEADQVLWLDRAVQHEWSYQDLRQNIRRALADVSEADEEQGVKIDFSLVSWAGDFRRWWVSRTKHTPPTEWPQPVREAVLKELDKIQPIYKALQDIQKQ